MFDRIRRAIALLVIFALALPSLFAQGPLTQSKRPQKKGPRAIAVVRWQADERGNAHPVLLPVAILDDGKVFDASIYRTSPEPMAIEPGTVYEAQVHGQPLGFFTVGTPSHSNSQDHPWIALGTWKTEALTDTPDQNARQAQVIIGTPTAKPGQDLPPVDEGEQRRKTTQVYDESGRPVDNPGEDEPPTLSKKGKREPVERSPRVGPTEPKPTPPSSPDDDPDRPRLKKGAPAPTSSAAPVAPPPSPADNDPNRPVLKRGRPAAQNKQASETADTPVPRDIISRSAVTRPRTYELVAVSDANDVNIVPQNYEFKSSLSERESYLRKMQDLVDRELRSSAAPAAKSSGRRPKSADPSRFANIRFQMLDIDSNNSPELVMTGDYILSAKQRIPFMLVARGDYEGNLRQLEFEKSDRFEFIDAVDLDADGPGELLFRRITAGGSEFVLYRVSVDGLSEVFRGGSAD